MHYRNTKNKQNRRQIKQILILTLCTAIFSAFSSTDTKPVIDSTPENTPEAVSTATPAPVEEKTAEKNTAKDVTGVAACAEHLAEVEKFVNNQKVPQAVRDTYKQSLEQNRTAWKQAALESGCKTALDSAKLMLEKCAR